MDEPLCNSFYWKRFVIVPCLRATSGCALGDSVYLMGFNLLLEPPLLAWLLLVVAPPGLGSFPLRARSTRWQCNGKNLPCRGGKAEFHPKTTRHER